MVSLPDLPPEIIHNIFRHVEPRDLAWIPRVCKTFDYTIRANFSLFKSVYLAHYDTPLGDDVNWEQDLKAIVHLQSICNSSGTEHKRNKLSFVYDTVNRMLKNASSSGTRAGNSATHAYSINADLLARLFDNQENQHVFLARSFIYERARGELSQCAAFSSPPKKEHQMSAKLHCLYGVPLLSAHRSAHETRSGKMAPFACSKVYDLRQYTDRTRWGPFMDDGSDRTDWERVEAIMLVLGNNLRRLKLTMFPICKNFWDTPFAGVWPGSYMALPLLQRDPADGELLEDPYGITGTWLRVVCFLDYTDFFEFNFSPDHELPSNVPRHAISYGEATRLILMRVSVTKIEPPGPEDGQALPVVHFKGVSRSLDDSWDENANSDLRGMVGVKGSVRLTREGEVRWTTFSVFNGQERWRSESVQVGGVKSAKGVFGNWFDKDYDPRGPAGPTAFWKISDRVVDGPERTVFLDDINDADILDDDFEPNTDEEDGNEDEDGEDDEENGEDVEVIEDVEIEIIIGPELAADVTETLAQE